MNVPTQIMTLRYKIASELTRFAQILDKTNAVQNTYVIYEAIRLLQNKTYGFHYPGTTDYRCWGYCIEDLTFFLPVPKKHVNPSSVHSLQVSIDADILCNYDDWETMNDPFVKLNFRARIKGLDSVKSYSFGFHIDKHIDEQHSNEIHPLYHIHYTPLVNENTTLGDVLSLDTPRLMHLPVDLVLGIDMILSNFAPAIWNKLRDEMVYQSIFRNYQSIFWKPYVHAFASRWEFNNANITWGNIFQICPTLMD
jgi:hypothetical protein